ncbi:hypothetical protein [Natrinema halophilum]|uniref:Uncharacterized protein n=1 Tax=Natrinema halophilum TaxID=1699371 RepID=A0A7D5KT15_9EURY|nr:hypothetical protein [Natrinema halophilum]QLG50024.1 hypothetical protein HYG82_14740 [Natrinema halophilum]
MNRRQYLTRTCAATGLLASVAGCLGDLNGASDTNDDNTDVASRAGERAIARAAGKLNKAAQSLSELGNLEDPENVEFDPSEPRNKISAARDHLETAEAELGEDRQADVEMLRSYADALEGLIEVTVTVTDDTISDDIDTVTTAIEEEGDIETASETVHGRYGEISAAHKRFEAADETIQNIDADRLTELAGIELTDLEDGADALGSAVGSLETLAAAYDSTLDTDAGYGALEQGRTDFENEAYETAKSEFETAESTFANARQNLENGMGNAPDGLVQYFETAECQNRHLATAAGEFAAAAGAATDGDPFAARNRKEDGEAALDDVRNCTS